MLTQVLAIPTISAGIEVVPGTDFPARPIVRVIWGKGYGSTYQGFYSPGRSCLGHPADEPGHPGGYSMFSGSLNCPGCRGPLRLRQAHIDRPDRLFAECAACRCRSLLTVGAGGRIDTAAPEDRNGSIETF